MEDPGSTIEDHVIALCAMRHRALRDASSRSARSSIFYPRPSILDLPSSIIFVSQRFASWTFFLYRLFRFRISDCVIFEQIVDFHKVN
jgi:hypothetical protein